MSATERCRASHNGFGRRLGTMIHRIDQIVDALPPSLEDIPECDTLMNGLRVY